MSKDPIESRIAALDKLAEVAPGDRRVAWSQAVSASAESSREVRAAAAAAVGAVGTPVESLPVLSRLVADDDVGVRMSAVSTTCALAWRGRVDVLVKALDDEDLGIRAVAADGLAHAGDVRASAVLQSLLSEKRLRFDALEGLLALRDESLERLAHKLAGGFLTPPFERALGELVLARRGDAGALAAFRSRLLKKRAEERPFVLVHLAAVDPGEGRKLVEAIAADAEDYLRESAILSLAKLDPSWWPRAQEAVGRWADEDPHVAAEVLLGLFDLDWKRTTLVADAHVHREGELGAAARRVRLQCVLREEFAAEILPRCA